MNRVVIVGGGASGMMAAISASDCGDQVTILEYNNILGKKILSTGNGRCNLSNRIQTTECYRSENPGFSRKILDKFPLADTLSFFQRIGIWIHERDGYLYPRSMQASSVRELLEQEVIRRGIDIRYESPVRWIKKEENGTFLVGTDTFSYSADHVIIASGGKASNISGSDGSGYGLAESLGHYIIPPVPALTGLTIKENPLKKASGVRTAGNVKLFTESMEGFEEIAEDTGELQLTDTGISGIPVFQVSRFAARALQENRKAKVQINFLPEFDISNVREAILLDVSERSSVDLLHGLLPDKLSTVLLRYAGIPMHLPMKEVRPEKKEKLLEALTQLTLSVSGTFSFERAQVSAGGVDTREVSDNTLESLVVSGIYFAGELLDVDGICGGYNLQWAWSSGWVAGRQGRI